MKGLVSSDRRSGGGHGRKRHFVLEVVEPRVLLSTLLANAAADVGVFQAPTTLPMSAAPVAMVEFRAAQLMSIASLVTLDDAGNIEVRLGNGDGTFEAPTRVATLPGATSMAMSDFSIFTTPDINGDGMADLVVANKSTGAIHVLTGNRDNSLDAPQLVATVASPQAIAIVGRDIVVASGAEGGRIVLLPNSGDGSFGPAISLASASNPVAVADVYLGEDPVTGDSVSAIVAANRDGDSVTVLEKNTDGTYKAPVTIPVGIAPIAVRGGSLVNEYSPDGFNLTSSHDIIVANSGSNDVTVLTRAADGGFTSRTFAAGNSPSAVATGDFNGDGVTDIAVSNAGGNSVSLILGEKGGRLVPGESYPVGSEPIILLSGVFNLNNFNGLFTSFDIITANRSGKDLTVLLAKEVEEPIETDDPDGPPPTPAEPVPPPVVTNLERVGVFLDPTVLLVGFSQPLDPSSAASPGNYGLYGPGRDGRLGTRDDRAIPWSSVSYDAASRTVALVPRFRLPLRGRFGLTIRGGVGGVTGQDGQPLEGGFSTVFGAGIWRGGRVAPRRPPIFQQRPSRPVLPFRGPRPLSARPALALRLALSRAASLG